MLISTHSPPLSCDCRSRTPTPTFWFEDTDDTATEPKPPMIHKSPTDQVLVNQLKSEYRKKIFFIHFLFTLPKNQANNFKVFIFTVQLAGALNSSFRLKMKKVEIPPVEKSKNDSQMNISLVNWVLQSYGPFLYQNLEPRTATPEKNWQTRQQIWI